MFCTAITPNGGLSGGRDAVNVPVQAGGIPVSPGDVIVADENGVVTVPRHLAASTLERIRVLLAAEQQAFAQADRGTDVRPEVSEGGTVEVNEFQQLSAEINDLLCILNLLTWDARTQKPPGGSHTREKIRTRVSPAWSCPARHAGTCCARPDRQPCILAFKAAGA